MEKHWLRKAFHLFLYFEGWGGVFGEIFFFSSSFLSFLFAQKLQTRLISKKLLLSVSRHARASQMRNSGKCLARILDKRKVLHAYS